MIKFVTVGALLALGGCCTFFGICDTSTMTGDIVRSLSYKENSPPANILPVGTPIRITSQIPFVSEALCSNSDVLGTVQTDWVPATSPTTQQTWQNKTTSSSNISLSSDEISNINGKIGVNTKSVQDVSVSFSNASVEAVTPSMMRNAVDKKHLTAACLNSILFDLTQPNLARNISMVSSVLKGSAKYNVIFDTSVTGAADASAKESNDKEIVAAHIGGGVTIDGSGNITGDNLDYGILDDRDLLNQLLDEVNKDKPNNDTQAAKANIDAIMQTSGRNAINGANVTLPTPQ